MAWTAHNIDQGVSGNDRFVAYSITAGDATSTVQTPLGWIDRFSVGAQSLSTGAPAIYANAGALGTAIAGMFALTGFAGGDVLFVTVYGR